MIKNIIMFVYFCRVRGGPGPLVPAGLQGAEPLDRSNRRFVQSKADALVAKGPTRTPIIAPASGNNIFTKVSGRSASLDCSFTSLITELK